MPVQISPNSLILDEAVIHFIEADVRRHDANRNLESPLFVFLSKKSGVSPNYKWRSLITPPHPAPTPTFYQGFETWVGPSRVDDVVPKSLDK
ncbi:unnamed protein product, partial [Timema podura]|nr:unnamed protein product [Timema podura]